MTNSPLYWSMLDAGLEEMGQEDICKKTDQSCSTDAWNFAVMGKKAWVSNYLKWVLPVTTLFNFNSFNTDIKKYLKGIAFKEVAGTTLLSEEDALFLRDMAFGFPVCKLHMPSFFTRNMLGMLFAVFVCFLGSALSPWLPLSPWLKVAANTGLVLVLSLLAVQIMVIMKNKAVQRRAKDFQEIVCIMLSAVTRSLDEAAKCIRFIQESELIVRGFTFVGGSTMSRVLAEFQMTSRQRQCPKLREKLFVVSKSLLFLLRESFSQVVRLCPVSVEVSGVMRYCSEIPLAQYPEMLHDAADSKESVEKLHDLTDGFSIHILKSMQELNHIHVSEFVRRLAVCFIQDQEVCDPFSALAPMLQKMTEELEMLHSDLQTHLAAHRHGSLHTSEKRTQKTAVWQPTSSLSHLQQTYTALHSLELHLLAALKKVQDISQAMERKIDSDGTKTDVTKVSKQSDLVKEEIDEPCRDAWDQMLQLVKSEISASTGCLEEGIKLLQKKSTTEEPLSAGSLAQQPLSPRTSESKIVMVSAHDNPIILDEVFEAYSEPQECRHGEHSRFTSAEEEAWHKKQKRDLKMCLHELQAIINIRAAETQERERIALDRMKSSTISTDQHLPSLESERQRSDNHSSMSDQMNSRAEDKSTIKSVTKTSCDDTDDLTKEIEDRVEFWKQFDLREQSAFSTVCKKKGNRKEENMDDNNEFAQKFDNNSKDTYWFTQTCKETHIRRDDNVGGSTESVRNSKENAADKHSSKTQCLGIEDTSGSCTFTTACKEPEDRRVDDIVKSIEENPVCIHSVITHDSETDEANCLVHKSGSLEESDFVFVTEQKGEEHILMSVSTVNMPRKEVAEVDISVSNEILTDTNQTYTDDASVQRFSADIFSDESKCVVKNDTNLEEETASRHCHLEETITLSKGEQEGEKKSSLKVENIVAVEDTTNGQHEDNATSDNVLDAVCRTHPEDTSEHLSLPAAPSPFAFSIASMVASQAKNFAQSEDIFGDSSSDEGGETEDGDSQVILS